MLEAILQRGGLNPELSARIAELGCNFIVEPTVGRAADFVEDQVENVTKKVRSKLQRTRDKILRQELSIFTNKGRKKNGEFKNGWDQAKVMRLAQKATSKRMRK